MDIKTAIAKLTNKSDAQIIETAKKAFVRIDAFNPSTGFYENASAFFINPDGYLMTNFHVVNSFLFEGGRGFIFTLSDGSTIGGSFEVTRCSDDRKIDLCILKLNIKNEYYFNIVPTEEKIGQKVFAFGNREWNPIMVGTGTVLDVYQDIYKMIRAGSYDSNHNVRVIEVDMPLFKKGFSGGPIFDSNGDLVAVSTMMTNLSEMYPHMPNAKLGISSNEVYSYMTSKTIFSTRYSGKKYWTDEDLFKLGSLKRICSKYSKECLRGIEAVCVDKKRQEDCTEIKAFYADVIRKRKL